jgi:hypothetical protein
MVVCPMVCGVAWWCVTVTQYQRYCGVLHDGVLHCDVLLGTMVCHMVENSVGVCCMVMCCVCLWCAAPIHHTP